MSYASRHLNKAEQNYSATEQECLTVVFAARQFRPYIFGIPFTVVTDQASLTWLMTTKNPSGRLTRWSLLLQEFNISLRHRPGSKNANADALSRLPYDDAPTHEEEMPVFVAKRRVDVIKLQGEDKFLKEIIHLKNPSAPVPRKLRRTARAFSLKDGVLFRRAKGFEEDKLALAVPKALRREILVSCHDDITAGHLGMKITLDKIRQRYFWPKMFAEITRYVSSCPDCQTRKTPPMRPSGLLQPLPPAQRPFQRIGMDFLGPLTTSSNGNRHVIVMIAYHTKWVEAVATPEATAACAAKAFLEAVVLRHGAPEQVVTDRGHHFVAGMTKELFRLTQTNHARTAAYHPQTNGLCERFNRTIAEMISQYVSTDHRDWDEFLPFATFAYNTSVQETTGYTPFFLLYGHEPTLPIDAALHVNPGPDTEPSNEEFRRRWGKAKELVLERERRAQEANKQRYDSTHREQQLVPGGFVYLRMPVGKRGRTSKFLHPYHGPYRLVRQTAENDWEVENRRGRRDVVNVNRLKPYIDRGDNPEHCPPRVDGQQVQLNSPGTMEERPTTSNLQAEDTDDDGDEFFDAVDSLPCDNDDSITPTASSTRPRRTTVPHRQDDFIYY